MRKFRILTLLATVSGLVGIILFSCNKGNTIVVKPNTTIQGTKATIIYTGDIAADGCDYLVQIDSATFYHADNLPSKFQKNNLNVTVNYTPTEATFQCGMNPDTRFPIIHIKDIQNR